MTAWKISSVPTIPVSTYAYVPGAVAALSASTSVATAVPLFSISIRPTMSASRALIAATILACCRTSSSAVFAPRLFNVVK